MVPKKSARPIAEKISQRAKREGISGKSLGEKLARLGIKREQAVRIYHNHLKEAAKRSAEGEGAVLGPGSSEEGGNAVLGPESARRMIEEEFDPVRREMIRFVDLGAGRKGGKALRKAKRRHEIGKPGLIVAVDTVKQNNYAKPPNYRSVQSDALEYLRSLPDKSVRTINFDLSLSTAAQEKLYRKRKQTEGNLKPENKNIMLTEDLAKHMKRVLAKNGELFIHTHEEPARDLARELAEHGFSVRIHPMTDMWKKIPDKSPHIDKMIGEVGEHQFLWHSVHIVAKPKKK